MQDDELQAVLVRPEEAPWATEGTEALTIFADDIRGASVLGGIARLNLVEHRVNPVTNELTTKVVAVLAVPVECQQPDRRVEIEVLGSREMAATPGTPAAGGTAGSGSSAPR